MRLGVSWIAGALALVAGHAWAAKLPALDDGLYAEFSNNQTNVQFSVCGSTDGDSGCFGSATLSPFDYACGVLQGAPKTTGDTITRAIYVLDKRTSATDDVMLYVYERKDVIAKGRDKVSAKLKATIDLGITGGAGSHCMLAGNPVNVYAATDASTYVVAVKKSNYHLTDWNGPPVSITADDRGFITLNMTWGFYVIDPEGNGLGDGGGSASLINQLNGWIQN